MSPPGEPELSQAKWTNVWPFANPVMFYTRLLEKLLNASGRTSHMILATRTAHPNLLIAARLANMTVIALVASSPHSMQHGEELLHQKLMMKSMAAAKKQVRPRTDKRLSMSQASFVTCTNLIQDSAGLKSFVPKANWRAGFNQDVPDLAEKMSRLLHQDFLTAPSQPIPPIQDHTPITQDLIKMQAHPHPSPLKNFVEGAGCSGVPRFDDCFTKSDDFDRIPTEGWADLLGELHRQRSYFPTGFSELAVFTCFE